MSREAPVKSKILSHFIKGKVSLSPMETVLMIPGELQAPSTKKGKRGMLKAPGLD
jgi:hypothetical protein